MDRYEKARTFVFSHLNSIYNDNLRLAAITHTSGVDTMAALLSLVRGVDAELAKTAALFHDFAAFTENCPHMEHSRLGARHARQYMKNANCYTAEEIDAVCFAIEQHSLKQQYDTPLAEVLKDADIMAHFTENPSQNYTGIKRQRILETLADLQLYMK